MWAIYKENQCNSTMVFAKYIRRYTVGSVRGGNLSSEGSVHWVMSKSI